MPHSRQQFERETAWREKLENRRAHALGWAEFVAQNSKVDAETTQRSLRFQRAVCEAQHPSRLADLIRYYASRFRQNNVRW